MIRNEEWSTMRRLLLMHGAMGAPLKEYEAEGNPAVFQTNVAKPLSGFTIPFLPVQQGSGDPSPQNKRPISGWSGVTAWRTGVNVFDASANPRRDGYLLNDNGVEQSSGSSGYTNGHISVTPGKTYIISGSIATGSGTWRIYNFDRDKNFIGRTETISSYVIPYSYTIPDGCYYIAIQYQASYADLSTIQIELGGTVSHYTEYTGQSYHVTFPALGKNLLNIEQTEKVDPGASGSTITIADGVISVDAIASSGRTYVAFDQEFPAGTYTIQAKASGSCDSARLLTSVEISGSEYNSYYGMYLNGYIGESGVTFTLPSAGKIGLNLQNAAGQSGNPGSAYDIQVEAGENKTDYEPFTNTVYGGTVYPLDGRMLVEWAKVDFADLVWVNTNQSANGVFRANLPSDRLLSERFNVVSDEYKSADSSLSIAGMPDNTIKGYNGEQYQDYVYIRDSRFTDQAAFIEGVDCEIVYQLATPIEIQLDPLTISTLIGDNTIWSDTNGVNTVKYKKKG